MSKSTVLKGGEIKLAAWIKIHGGGWREQTLKLQTGVLTEAIFATDVTPISD